VGRAVGHYAFINQICSQFLVGLDMPFGRMPNGSSEANKVTRDIGCDQFLGLILEGVEELHFCTLNRSDLIVATWDFVSFRFTSSPSFLGAGS